MGFAYFAATKLVGYSLFCRYAIQTKLLPASPRSALSVTGEEPVPERVAMAFPFPNPWLAGTIRTLVGITVGAVVGLSFWKIPFFAAHENALGDAGFFILLVPIRIGEWYLLLHTVYRNFPSSGNTKAFLISFGILVSFLVDAAGVAAAFILPGGMWVC